MNWSSSVLPVGHCLRCCLFVCFHCVPEIKGSISERLLSREYKAFFSDTIADTVPEREHQKGDQIQSGKVMSVLVYSPVWMDSCRSDCWLDLFLWISSACFVLLQQRLPLLYPPPPSPPLQQLRGKRNTRERPQLNMTRRLQ